MPTPLVSIVIPCYNPAGWLEETLASAGKQTHPAVEIVLVNDGTSDPASLELLRRLAPQAARYIEQPNRGLAAARNAGFAAASGEYVVPLDADDRLQPAFVAECLAAMDAHPEAAFVYTDYRVFGDRSYVERTREYNLYELLSRNILIYAALIRRADWQTAGGYDESETLRWGYEDWDFWLRLGERERFGHHLGRVLFHYRKHGRSLLTLAEEHHHELLARIRENHRGLYSRQGRVRVKTRWAPAVCVLGPEIPTPQTIEDWHRLPASDRRLALEQSRAEAYLVPEGDAPVDPHAAELAALAVWGGHDWARLPGRVLVLARRALLAERPRARPRLEWLGRHLANAEIDVRRPRTWLRLIPLRLKERINRAAGRPLFDLSFYLRFQPESVLVDWAPVEPLRYLPRPAEGRRRIALVTPHLGPGGAESVLLEVAGAIDRARWEVFLIATQSRDERWRKRWDAVADHVYDLAAVVEPQRWVAALYSMGTNWEWDALVVQNSMAGYSAIPHLRRDLPALKVVDLIHAADDKWDFAGATAAVAPGIDRRVAISEAAAGRLRRSGTPPERIRLIRNGIDLERFRPPGEGQGNGILFAGRLDPVKRPLLLAPIAAEMARLCPQRDFEFVVAGDGADGERLRRLVKRKGLESRFRMLGLVEDMPAALAASTVVVIPSKAEGIPLVALEAFAMERPVVCARVGAAEEAIDAECGALIDPGPGEAGRFAAALHALLDDPARRRRMGQAGRRKVEAQYSRERARESYRSLLAEL